MSINSALSAGVSGLEANTSALSAISQNIANVNTVGYKSEASEFNDLVTQANATGTYSAGGVSSVVSQNVSLQGSTTQTTSPTDLAISGQGMFVTTQSATTIGATTPVLFTRAGSFTPNSQGYLENSAGLYLQAWPADGQGNILNTGTNLSGLAPVNVTSIGGAVSATTTAGINANLNASQAVSTQATDAGLVVAGTATPAQTAAAYDPTSATTSMTAYDATTGTGTKPDFTVPVQVSDSQGGQHTLQYDFLKSSTPNQWYVEVQAVPASDVQSGASLVPGQVATGIVAFNPDGSINTNNTTLPTSLAIGPSTGTPAATGVNWATSLGVAAQTINVSLSPGASTSGLTQDASTSAIQSVSTNGTPYGNLSSVAIDPTGVITATFDNGTNRVIGQVALATFPNVDGLTATSGDAYVSSTTSGAYSLKAAGSGGAGKIASSSLESSTVDLSAEFANLIVTQRAYTASSKIITTADQMTQDLLSIIR